MKEIFNCTLQFCRSDQVSRCSKNRGRFLVQHWEINCPEHFSKAHQDRGRGEGGFKEDVAP